MENGKKKKKKCAPYQTEPYCLVEMRRKTLNLGCVDMKIWPTAEVSQCQCDLHTDTFLQHAHTQTHNSSSSVWFGGWQIAFGCITQQQPQWINDRLFTSDQFCWHKHQLTTLFPRSCETDKMRMMLNETRNYHLGHNDLANWCFWRVFSKQKAFPKTLFTCLGVTLLSSLTVRSTLKQNSQPTNAPVESLRSLWFVIERQPGAKLASSTRQVMQPGECACSAENPGYKGEKAWVIRDHLLSCNTRLLFEMLLNPSQTPSIAWGVGLNVLLAKSLYFDAIWKWGRRSC